MPSKINLDRFQARWTQYKTEHATTLRVAKWSSLSLVVAAALLGVGAIAMRYGGHYQLNAAGFKQLGQDMGTLGPKMTSWWNSGRYSGGAMMATVAGTLGGVALIGAGVKYGPKAVKTIGKKTPSLKRTEKTDNASNNDGATQQAGRANKPNPWTGAFSDLSGSESGPASFSVSTSGSEAGEEQASHGSGQSESAPQQADRQNAPPVNAATPRPQQIYRPYNRHVDEVDHLFNAMAEGLPLGM